MVTEEPPMYGEDPSVGAVPLVFVFPKYLTTKPLPPPPPPPVAGATTGVLEQHVPSVFPTTS